MNAIEQYLSGLLEELNRRTNINLYWNSANPELMQAIEEECARLGVTFERRAS
jgi:hypothetical protein